MANVVHKVTAEYRESVDTSQYTSGSPLMWLINPDLSNVVNVEHKYWKVVEDEGAYDVVEMTQQEKDVVDTALQNEANTTIAGTYHFEKDGKVKNKWIGFSGSKTSDTTPFVVPENIRISAITFTNSANNCDTDVEIYKNSTLDYTWQIRNARVAWKTSGLYNLTLNQGDLVGIYIRDQGTDPRDVIVSLHFTVINNIVNDGSIAAL